MDFKAEGKSGQVVEALAQRCSTPHETPASSFNGAGPDSLAFVHSIRRRGEGGDGAELVRCRTPWHAGVDVSCGPEQH